MGNWEKAKIYILPSAVIAFLGYACYLPVLRHYFWEDDFVWIEEGRAALSNPSLFFKFQPNFRPLCRLFFSLCWMLFGSNPAPYYFLALSVHVATGIAVYFALTALLKNRQTGFAAAVLFTVSNTHSDAVFWLVANCGPLGLLFFALSLLAWVSYRETKKRSSYWLAAGLIVLALFSKEDAMVYPALLVLTDVLLGLSKGISLKDRIKEYVPFAAILVLFVSFELYLQIDPARRSGSLAGEGIFNFHPMHLFSNAISAFHYMLLGVWMPEPRPSLLVITLTVLAVVGACVWLAGRERTIWAALWSLMPFLPMCGYAWAFYPSIETSYIRRHLYIPSLGASVLVALLLAGIFSKAAAAGPRFRKGAAVAFFLAIAVLSAFGFSEVRERSSKWGERTLILKAEADAVKMLIPRPAQPAGFVLVDFTQRPFYNGDMLRIMYGDWSISHYDTWQKLEADNLLNGRYLVRIRNGAVYDVGTGRWLPLELKDRYK